MVDLHGFDASNVEPRRSFEPIPSGKYIAVIENSELIRTKAGNGHFIELTFQIVEGEYKNRLLWTRLNLDNPNDQAVKIAQAELSAICRAVGKMVPKDSYELHNIPMVINVRRKTKNGEIRNDITGYEKREASNGKNPASSTNPMPWSN